MVACGGDIGNQEWETKSFYAEGALNRFSGGLNRFI